MHWDGTRIDGMVESSCFDQSIFQVVTYETDEPSEFGQLVTVVLDAGPWTQHDNRSLPYAEHMEHHVYRSRPKGGKRWIWSANVCEAFKAEVVLV